MEMSKENWGLGIGDWGLGMEKVKKKKFNFEKYVCFL
jgi:hypothetical protein